MNIRLEEELDDLERLALTPLSYSRINTYEMCNAKYFYQYILKEDVVFGPAATMGNVLHSVLEDHVGKELNYEKMVLSMYEHREKYDPEYQIDQAMMNDGKKMLGEFVDRHSDEEFDIIGKEVPFQVVIGQALVRGFIDLVVRDPDGTIRVCDYKSGKFEVAQKNIHSNLQLGIYALAVNKLFPGEERISVELYYLRSGKRKGHVFTIDDLEDVHVNVLNKINEILENEFFPVVKDKTFVCKFCDFRKTGVCKTGVARFGKA